MTGEARTDDDRSVGEQAAEFVLFAPFELAAKVIEGLPSFCRRGVNRLMVANMLGRFAVQQGANEIRRRLEGTPTDPGTAEPVAAEPASDRPAPTDDRPSVDLDPSRLPLPDYDLLPAAHIVDKLGSLTSEDLEMVEQYELAHRHRRTVLGRIDQLRSAG